MGAIDMMHSSDCGSLRAYKPNSLTRKQQDALKEAIKLLRGVSYANGETHKRHVGPDKTKELSNSEVCGLYANTIIIDDVIKTITWIVDEVGIGTRFDNSWPVQRAWKAGR